MLCRLLWRSKIIKDSCANDIKQEYAKKTIPKFYRIVNYVFKLHNNNKHVIK